MPDSSEPSSKASPKPSEPAAKKPAKKAAARKSAVAVPVAKSAGKKAPAKKTTAKKPAAKKTPAKKTPAKKSTKQPAPLRGKQAVTDAKRLSGWDFATWRMATDDPVMRSTIIGLLVLDSSPDWERMKQRYDRATRLAPVLRSRVVEGPIGLQSPRIVVDPNFDLSFHMRRFSMPKGSTWADVLEDARRQSMADFDRDRPLWRVTLLEGLPGGKAALILKLHHAIADGQGAVQLGLALLDFTPEGVDLGPMPDAPEAAVLDTTGFLEAVIRNNVGWVARTAQDVINGLGPLTMAAVKNPGELIGRVRETAGSVARFTRIPFGPMSPIMQQRSINYHFDTIDMDFSLYKAEAKRRGRSVNDLFLAAISIGMNRYHERMGRPVDELRMNMPISLRTSGEDASNAVTIARFEIPVSNVIDDVLDAAAETVRSWRAEPALKLADNLAELSRFLPPELLSAAAQTSDLTASNVPGPPIPVWLAGAKVERMYPLVGTIGAAINITMLTYNGIASVGVSTDDAAVDDRDELVRSLRHGFREVIGSPVLAGNPLTIRKRT
ncbi:MAG: WS/DGAT domain-containing protein [Candidatus Nanopelagicales bacterium]|nr:WS/DGAT domain-containing protein [Candidatus Nanopelagicales bacterium]MCU0298150.1 WS/DGAT domain-containing protein [Candidatus Nanopelagicales bacterium]